MTYLATWNQNVPWPIQNFFWINLSFPWIIYKIYLPYRYLVHLPFWDFHPELFQILKFFQVLQDVWVPWDNQLCFSLPNERLKTWIFFPKVDYKQKIKFIFFELIKNTTDLFLPIVILSIFHLMKGSLKSEDAVAVKLTHKTLLTFWCMGVMAMFRRSF